MAKTRNDSISVSTTSLQVANDRYGKRTMLSITNTSAAAVITIAKGEVVAVAGAGIRLQPNNVYTESNDSGFRCWQGPIQIVADAAGTIGIVETFED